MPGSVSRRAFLGGLGVLAASSAAAEDAVSEADKIKQADARYQPRPKGEQRCEICLQFLPPAACKIVRGPIVAKGWCQFFAARENAQ
jgi:hypothetical protein